MRSCKWSFSPGITNSVRLVSRKLSGSHCIAPHTCSNKHFSAIISFCCCDLKNCISRISISCQWVGVISDILNSAKRHTSVVITSGHASSSGRQYKKLAFLVGQLLFHFRNLVFKYCSLQDCQHSVYILISLCRSNFNKGSQLWNWIEELTATFVS